MDFHHHLQISVPNAGIKIQHTRLTDMEYADDVFLLAYCPSHLQALITALADYCHELHMQVSIAKTKVMIIGDDTRTIFTCTNQPLEQVESFKYSGMPFHQSGHVAHLITPKLNKAAASWAIVQQKHAQLQCSDTVCLKFRLFQSILAPAFHYGCPVWGMHSPTDSAANNVRKQLEQKYMLYLKRLCGVPSTTSHAVILAELNMCSLKHFWWQQTIDFWNALASAPASCLHKLVLIDNLQDAFLHGVFMLPQFFLVSLSLPSQCWLPFTYSSPKYSYHRCQHSHSWT